MRCSFRSNAVVARTHQRAANNEIIRRISVVLATTMRARAKCSDRFRRSPSGGIPDRRQRRRIEFPALLRPNRSVLAGFVAHFRPEFRAAFQTRRRDARHCERMRHATTTGPIARNRRSGSLFGMLRRFGRRHRGCIMRVRIRRRIADHNVVAATGGNRLNASSPGDSHDSKQQRGAQSKHASHGMRDI